MGRKKVIESLKPWIFKGKEILTIDQCPENSYGFIYLITQNSTGKKYIGKKSLYSYKSKISHVLNEKTRRMNKVKETIATESNWKEYYGSNIEINKLIRVEGKDNFTREILQFCFSKKELTYRELTEQCKRDVLDSDMYWNDNILGKFFKFEFSKVEK